MFKSEIMTALFSFLTHSEDAVLNTLEQHGEAYLFFNGANLIRFNSPDEVVCRERAREIFESLLANENAKIQSLEEEIEYLSWFYSCADFGPADEDVRFLMNKSYVEDGGVIPKGYQNDNEEDDEV